MDEERLTRMREMLLRMCGRYCERVGYRANLLDVSAEEKRLGSIL